MCLPLLSLICTYSYAFSLSHVCPHVHLYVISHVSSHMCTLIYGLSNVQPCMLSYRHSSVQAPICAIIQVPLKGVICMHYICVRKCAPICVFTYVCSHTCPLVRACALMTVLYRILPTTRFGISSRVDYFILFTLLIAATFEKFDLRVIFQPHFRTAAEFF